MEKLYNSEDKPKFLSLQLLNEVTNNFSEERKIGTGAYGEVYKGIHNGEEIAVKRLRPMLDVDKSLEQFKKEIENLWKLRHQNIVQLLGYCCEIRHEVIEVHGKLCLLESIFRALCFEYMHNGSLRSHLYDEYQGVNWRTRYRIIKGICEGLKYLHEGLEIPIFHMDIKPENILLDKNMVPKLSDFGLSKLVHNDQTQPTLSLIGTIGYLPPEYLESNLISKKLDIFSLGVVIIRIMTGYEGYYKSADMSSQDFIDLVHNNWRSRLKATQDCSSIEYECHQVKRCIKIALDCVKYNRKERPEIGTIVHWLNETEHTATSSTYKTIEDTESHVVQPSEYRSIKHDSNATLNVGSVSMDNPPTGSMISQLQTTEYNFKLYLHQIIEGLNKNQVNLVDPKQNGLFGYTNVHDYPMYDSLDPSASIVARAQGLHTETSMNYNNWFHWSSIVFNGERFQGSSFVAIGNLTDEGEWAIVGGTGVFTFAQGSISLSRIQQIGSLNIMEVQICMLCYTSMNLLTRTTNKTFRLGMIRHDSDATLNVACPSLANSQADPMISQVRTIEYNFKLYLHQIIEGPMHNQVNIADPKQPQLFGYTNVHDYPMYDSLDPNANIVARAQGLHTETSMNYNDWFHWSSIVFNDERFEGSSFVAIGNQEGEWAIVGGTGVFTFAQGTVSSSRIQQIGSSNIKEIRINALCHKPLNFLTRTINNKPFKYGSININFDDATINVGDGSMANQDTSLVISQLQTTKYTFRLYLHQIIERPENNQVNIVDPKQPQMFGYTNVHDCPMYDSLDPNANIIARAQGLHTEASMNYNDWFHWSNIVFKNQRFQGSSFVAIGNVTHEGEWAIVGGTGVFTFAQGTITLSRIRKIGSSNIKEIQIYALCHTPSNFLIGTTNKVGQT